jgi:hypothetical protein
MSNKQTTVLPDTELVTKRSMDRIPVDREEMIAQAQAEQVVHRPADGVGTHMLFDMFTDPKNKPGEVRRIVRTFVGKNAEDIRLQINYYIMKHGVLKAYNISPEDLEKLQNEESKESA